MFKVNGRNLLLIDHPVNTGLSYSVNTSSYVTTDKDAGKFLVNKAIKNKHVLSSFNNIATS